MILLPKLKVTSEGSDPVEVQPSYRDVFEAEQRFQMSGLEIFTAGRSFGAVAFIAWTALRRTGANGVGEKFDDWLAGVIGVQVFDDEDEEADADPEAGGSVQEA